MSRRTSRRRPTGRSTGGIVLVLLLLIALYAFVQFQRNGTITIPLHSTQQPGATSGPAVPGASWYEVFFTTPRYPDKPEYHHGGLDEKLVAFINTATKTIDLADYDFDLENVARALAQAAARGVRVRMVTDTDT